MAINYYESKLLEIETRLDANSLNIQIVLFLHGGVHIIMWVLSSVGMETPAWHQNYVVAVFVTLFLLLIIGIQRFGLLADQRSLSGKIQEILAYYDKNDWNDARKEDVEWAVSRRWNQYWASVANSLHNKNDFFYLEANEPPLSTEKELIQYYQWLCHREEHLVNEESAKTEVSLLW